MAQADQWLREIKRLLDRYNGTASSEAADLLDRQLELVDGINARLERCVDFLRKGLHGEAIHQANIAPNVLDEAAVLSGPEATAWSQLCEEAQLGRAPSVDENLIIEVDQAFARGDGNDPLLSRHRLLALARAPLTLRIAKLRELSARDLDVPYWGDDLSDLEAHRLKQIRSELVAADAANDVASVNRLHEELSRPWLVPPPPELVKAVARLRAKLGDIDARAQLDELREPIRQAHDRDDDAALEPLLTEWRRLRQDVRHSAFTEDEAVEAAEGMTRRREARQLEQRWVQTLAGLEHALDHAAPLAELEQRWAAVERYERPVPEVLRTRFRSRQSAQRHGEGHERRAVMMGVVCGLVAVVALAGGGLWWLMDQRSRAAWDATIAEAIQTQRWDDARQLLGQLEQQWPALHAAPPFVSHTRRVAAFEESEDSRQQQWAEAMTRVEMAGTTTPDLRSLELAESLARTPEEESKARGLRLAITQEELKQQTLRNQEYGELLGQLRERYAVIRAMQGPPDLPSLENLQADLVRLNRRPGVDATTRAGGETLQMAIGNLMVQLAEQIQQRGDTATAVAQIQQAVGDPAAVDVAILRFLDRHPDHPLIHDLQRARLLNRPLVDLAAWNLLMPQLEDPLVDTRQQAVAEYERLVAALQATPQLQKHAALTDYLAYLHTAMQTLRAGDSDGDGLQVLRELVESPAFSGLFIIELADGRRLYTPQRDPVQVVGSGQVFVKYASSIEQLVGRVPLEQELMPADALEVSKTVSLAPQESWSRAILQQLDAGELRWETGLWDAAAQILTLHAIDPILRTVVVRQLGREAIESGWAVPHHEDAAWRILNTLDIEGPWIDTQSPGVAKARATLSRRLEAMPKLTPGAASLEQWRARCSRTWPIVKSPR